MRRRRFIAALGSVAAWPLAARAQQRDKIRRVGVLGDYAEDDPEALKREDALGQVLRQLGWREGENLHVEYRWGAGDPSRIRRFASELVRSVPEVIVTRPMVRRRPKPPGERPTRFQSSSRMSPIRSQADWWQVSRGPEEI
jgi:putative tryptophan/tyrosine transport system substrate-binding protein